MLASCFLFILSRIFRQRFCLSSIPSKQHVLFRTPYSARKWPFPLPISISRYFQEARKVKLFSSSFVSTSSKFPFLGFLSGIINNDLFTFILRVRKGCNGTVGIILGDFNE